MSNEQTTKGNETMPNTTTTKGNNEMKLIKTSESHYRYGIAITHYLYADWAVVDSSGKIICEVLNYGMGWEIVVVNERGNKIPVPNIETGKRYIHKTRKQVSDLALAWAKSQTL